ncbi:Uncharacterized protein dnl_43920 [Desulfonema limicola]|uniref:Uncharacterized protein n=1 Tax=Desulfonema limicola TaxID=45656 RepID=A0A975BB50_9BACT|nr:hypothetical protein [Desulfonema limicola]QTA82030.1 Uncharacterized protein dnl_43920 [Desulfonema limicola]
MSLIEHIEREDWKDILRNNFEYALYVMKNDRHRHISSSADDLRSWLAYGGVNHVKKQFNRQMKRCRCTEEKISEVNNFFDQLAQENRSRILDLTAESILPETKQEWFSTYGLSETDVEDIFMRMLKGERPFEDWMYSHGYSNKEIQEIYNVVDNFLLKTGIIVPPESSLLH